MQVEEELSKAINLKVKINAKVKKDLPLVDIVKKFKEDLSLSLKEKMASCIGFLSDSEWIAEGERLNIRLKNKSSFILKSKKCDKYLKDIVAENFNKNISVEFSDDFSVEEPDENSYIEKYSRTIEESAGYEVQRPAVSEKKEPKVVEPGKKQKKTKTSPDCILGKPITLELSKISEVTQDSGDVAIAGEVVKVDTRLLRNGKYLFTIDVTDRTSTINCKIFVDPDDFDYFNESIKAGSGIKLKGEAQYDKFTQEVSVKIRDISAHEIKRRKDTAPQKRVELHLHTQMSALDGLVETENIVKKAWKWGHKAVAITDHGVAQAYNDAFNAADKINKEAEKENKEKIKIIYGLEGYLFDDTDTVINSRDIDMKDADYVVFDVETTGLDNYADRLIEIGAVKITGGVIKDSFSTYVNPKRNIPSNITELTGITDEMVKDAPFDREAIERFLEFSKGCIFVAHNANFDIGFIREGAARHKLPFENRTAIDTLELSRRINKTLKSHKLDSVCKSMGVSLKNHHRAVDDSYACGEIFMKFFCWLIENGCEKISDISAVIEKTLGKAKHSRHNTYHVIILVKDKVGLKNLYKIISLSHLEYFYRTPGVPRHILEKYREGLIIGSACESGELYKAVLEKKPPEKIEKIASFYDYLEIQPLLNNSFLINDGKVSDNDELRDINKQIIRLGEKLGKLVVATCDVHIDEPWDDIYRKVLLAGKGFDDVDRQAPLYFRTTDEMLSEFSYLGEEKAFEVVVENTNKIADMIDASIRPIPKGMHPPSIEGADAELSQICWQNARKIYGEELPKIIEDRLSTELDLIIKNGYSVMYVAAKKLVEKSLASGYRVDSRGSVGSSLAATFSGITEVNPLMPHYVCPSCKDSIFFTDGSIKSGYDLPDKICEKCGTKLKKDGHDIPFETFLGFPGSTKIPDIDLNFSGEYQAEAHKYTEELFGSKNVFKAGTISTVAEKTAYGFAEKYMKERGLHVNKAEIERLALGCTGVKRTTGQHPGGIIVVPQQYEIYDFTPIQRPADDTDSDITTTHFDFNSIHDTILKLDILGHELPTQFKILEDMTGVKIVDVPSCDAKVLKLFTSTEPLGVTVEEINSKTGTLGLPENGTNFVRGMLIETQPKVFSDLLQIMGLSHGTDVWLGNARDLIINEKFTIDQVVAIRDDIMLYLIKKGLEPTLAFTITESVRKGKGLKPEWESAMRGHDVPDWYINSCKKIKYMFPKAHAAAYAMSALRLGWFKINYPSEFYAAFYSTKGSDLFDITVMGKGRAHLNKIYSSVLAKGKDISKKEEDMIPLMEIANEMYARKIDVLPIDLYKSHAYRFLVEDKNIRPPLNSIPGMGEQAALSIAEARESGEFESLEDLRQRTKVNKTTIAIMKENGFTNNLPDSSQMTLFDF